MKRIFYKTGNYKKAFSLGEVLAAMAIGSMILVAVLSIYSRTQRSSAAISRKLDGLQLPREVLQRIAEDLDDIISVGPNTRITIKNKFDELYATARLEIEKTIYDRRDKPATLEKIIWQTSYDYDSDANGLVLYRSHSGITVEDKLLDESKDDWERELFVPICSGITFFSIQIPHNEILLDDWSQRALPKGIIITISFAEPFERLDGTWNVFDEDKIVRTVAIDRTRRIKFKLTETKDPNVKDSSVK